LVFKPKTPFDPKGLNLSRYLLEFLKMRKKVFGRHLSRGRKSREALFRSLTRALIERGAIVTTKAKAKAVAGQADKLISKALKNSISARREILAYLGNDRSSLRALFETVIPSFEKRVSGFTRIIQLPPRRGDNAEMARLEWVDKVAVSGKRIADREETTGEENKKITVSKKNTKNPNNPVR
jgi:large subunit ribosomal protein L17